MSLDTTRAYRRVYILDSRNEWSACRPGFDPQHDLVLTFDFGLRQAVEQLGGTALFLDHLLEPAALEQDNFRVYEFLRTWHRDAAAADIFRFRGVDFGFSLRIEIWNDLIFQTRLRLCLEQVARLRREALIVATRAATVESVLAEMGMAFERAPSAAGTPLPVYAFPIHRWMDEQLRSRKFKHLLKPFVARVLGLGRLWWARLLGSRRRAVFVQEYYPTRRILQLLQREPGLRVVQAQYSWAPGLTKLLREHPIPLWGSPHEYARDAAALLRAWRERRAARLVLGSGLDVSAGMYRVIEERIASQLADSLRVLACVIEYLDANPLQLEVMISNIGKLNTLVDCVCRSRGVRSYLIINGVLAQAYMDEGKYASVINAYSSSIRDHYFRGMDNIVCLGDPRMDAYVPLLPRKRGERGTATITIGAAGYNVTNLNSYVAVEFDFLNDVLLAVRQLKERGVDVRVIVKVRDNGYRDQYERFVAEYFPGVVQEVLDATPMRQVLERTDFYISIYSQTLFEASCLGIPALYYKKDTESLFPPFDGRSELVTATSVEQLVAAFEDFLAGGARFDAFLRRDVMEQYIGPLDGRNLERNMNQIHAMLGAAAGVPG